MVIPAGIAKHKNRRRTWSRPVVIGMFQERSDLGGIQCSVVELVINILNVDHLCPNRVANLPVRCQLLSGVDEILVRDYNVVSALQIGPNVFERLLLKRRNGNNTRAGNDDVLARCSHCVCELKRVGSTPLHSSGNPAIVGHVIRFDVRRCESGCPKCRSAQTALRRSGKDNTIT